MALLGDVQDVAEGRDDEGEGLEPMYDTDAPFVFNHHEADAAGEGNEELGIVEPAVHVEVGLVVQCPLGPGAGTDE